MVFDNFCKNLGISYYVIATEKTKYLRRDYFPTRQNRTFLTDNYFDFIRNNEASPYKIIYDILTSPGTLEERLITTSGEPDNLARLYQEEADGHKFYPSYFLFQYCLEILLVC